MICTAIYTISGEKIVLIYFGYLRETTTENVDWPKYGYLAGLGKMTVDEPPC